MNCNEHGGLHVKRLINVIIVIIIIVIISVFVAANFNTVKTWPVVKDFFEQKVEEGIPVKTEETIFRDAKRKNMNVIGLLSIGNLISDLVITGTNDNNYYLGRNAEKRYDGIGSAFLDESNNGVLEKVNVIYGRNKDSLFGRLDRITNENTEPVYLFDGKKKRKYSIFSVYKSKTGREYFDSSLTDGKDIARIKKTLEKKSIEKFLQAQNQKNEILILCQFNSNLSQISKVVCAVRVSG